MSPKVLNMVPVVYSSIVTNDLVYFILFDLRIIFDEVSSRSGEIIGMQGSSFFELSRKAKGVQWI